MKTWICDNCSNTVATKREIEHVFCGRCTCAMEVYIDGLPKTEFKIEVDVK